MAGNPPAPGAPPPPVDLVTALQEALGRVNGVLFNYLGALQRDAPPSSVKGEALLAPPKAYDVQARCRGACSCGRSQLSPRRDVRREGQLARLCTRRRCSCCEGSHPYILLCLLYPACPPVQTQAELMSKDLAASLQEAEQLIARLPDLPASEAAEVAAAAALTQQNAEASAELAAELAAASAKLATLQDAHGALAEAALAHKAAVAAAAAAAAKSGGAGGAS